MSDILKIKELAKEKSILYVEDSKTIQKQISLFLNKLFNETYQAFDGLQGLELYKQNPTDIVLTDLDMPILNGIDMIKEIKSINPNAKIIILSAHADVDNLSEAVKLGVKYFVNKPIDFDNLKEVFLAVLENFSSESNEDKELFDILDILIKNHQSVELLNHYKGIPILNEVLISHRDKSNIFIKVNQKLKGLILKEKESLIISSKFSKNILAIFEKVVDEYLLFSNLRYIDSSSKDRKEIRVIPDETFLATVHHKSIKIDIDTIDISSSSISFYTKTDSFNFAVDDSIDITISCNILVSNDFSLKQSEVLFVKADVLKIDGNKIIANFKLNKSNKTVIDKYIKQRGIELIAEYRKL